MRQHLHQELSDPPRVSIVTPSFNQAPYLEATIKSVLGQSYPNVEYIVIDGGSSDGSRAIIERYADRLAYWQSEPDGGLADALAQGFARATGEILAYLNSDDLLAADAVEQAVRCLARRPEAVMVYGNRVCIDERGRLLYLRPSAPFLAGSRYGYVFIAQESCFWRRAAFESVGGVDASLSFAVDYDLFSRLAFSGELVHCGAVWGFFRRHRHSKTMRSFATVGRREVAQVQRKVWGRVAPRWGERLAQAAFRLYLLGYGAAGGAPDIPLPPRASWPERVRSAFHNEHWLARALDQVVRRDR